MAHRYGLFMSYMPPRITPEMIASQERSRATLATQRAANAAEGTRKRLKRVVAALEDQLEVAHSTQRAMETQLELAKASQVSAESAQKFSKWISISSLIVAVASLGAAVAAIFVTLN